MVPLWTLFFAIVSCTGCSDENNGCFYFCMGAGSDSSTAPTGFDKQIDLGTSTLHKWYQHGADNYSFLIIIHIRASEDIRDMGQQDTLPQYGVKMQQRILFINIRHIHVPAMIVPILQMFYF